MLDIKNRLLITLTLSILFIASSYASIYSNNTIKQQISFVNLTPDTITLTNTSRTRCTDNISGLFKGNSIVLSKIEFNNTDNTGRVNIAQADLMQVSESFCVNVAHSETLMLTSSLQIAGKSYQLPFTIYLPIEYTYKGDKYGGLSFDSNNNDQGNNLTTLSLADSKQLANVDLTKYPYLLQIQGSHLGNDGSDTQQPIIYIYRNPAYCFQQ